MSQNLENLVFIVFLIDSKYKSHDGKVFRSIDAARAFCKEWFTSQQANEQQDTKQPSNKQ